MLEQKEIQSLDDFFIELNRRQNKGVYFYRINGYSEKIHDFILKYYDAARCSGVVIEGKIPNPDEKNLAYYEEIMGMNFQMSKEFILGSLKKWLPRMNDFQRETVALSIYSTLDNLRKAGKNENILKNAYIKFMCWLYYRFERIVNQLGENNIPKILYEGNIGNYELMIISILSKAGCDVVLLQYGGDQEYIKVDKTSAMSKNYVGENLQLFPQGYSLKKIREEIQEKVNNERLYGTKPSIINCTNAWIKGNGLDDIRTAITTRGMNQTVFYNAFYRINGVWDKLMYANDLYQFQLELKNSQRKVVVVNETIQKPTPDEVSRIRHGNYGNIHQMIMDLSDNIKYSANIELQRIMVKAFVDIILEESKRPDENINKLTSKAVYLLCWLKRYQSQLFSNWKYPEVSCFIFMGACQNDSEALFIRFLARIPIDVLLLSPNLDKKCVVEDSLLYEIHYDETMVLSKFPEDNAQVSIGTAAYHAERELDALMYQDSGLYRNQQYSKANSVNLQTMYEEIAILWNQELKYRPSFSTVDDMVNIPVIFAKVSGVKDGVLSQYWDSIKELITEDVFYVKNAPYIQPGTSNPMKTCAIEFFKNGRLQRSKIKNHSMYKYGFLREEVQDYILDKLQLLIDQKTVKGTFENGTEYTIIATVLNLNKEIVRLIQKFDFTKKNPKMIYVNTTEEMISLEDTIIVLFLNLIGFDIVFFVPTGYQSIEKHFNNVIMEEHQIGEYMYDIQVPNLDRLSSNKTHRRWRDIFFKRGN